MKTFPDRTCAHCAMAYTPTGANSRFCAPKCKADARNAAARALAAAEGRKRGGTYGIPDFNAHLRTTTIALFQKKLRPAIKAERRFCERCRVDLIDAAPAFWCTHHRDRDRTNNTLSNLELLCKRCHQVEHACHWAFKKRA